MFSYIAKLMLGSKNPNEDIIDDWEFVKKPKSRERSASRDDISAKKDTSNTPPQVATEASDSKIGIVTEIKAVSVNMPISIPPMSRFAIGNNDFKSVREKGGMVVDTSLLIKELIDDPIKIKLIIRPRRFGKTFNMSMLRYYFEKSPEGSNRSSLFSSLSIWQMGKHYQDAQGQYPVFFITFKDITSSSFESAYLEIKILLSNLYLQYKKILFSSLLNGKIQKQNKYMEIVNKEASEKDTLHAFKKLIKYIHLAYNKKPIILIDEFDTPFHASATHGYHAEMIKFMHDLFTISLENNAHIEQAVLTGILAARQKKILAPIDFRIYNMLSDKYSDYFGFSKEQVKGLLGDNDNALKLLAQLEDWYGGYYVGNKTILNPWAIVNFIEDNRVRKGNEKIFKSYWVSSSENKLVEELLQANKEAILSNFKSLLENQPAQQIINEPTAFFDIKNDLHSLWGFLLFNGYLTSTYSGGILEEEKDDRIIRNLIIPNQEIFNFYKKQAEILFPEEKKTYMFRKDSKEGSDMQAVPIMHPPANEILTQPTVPTTINIPANVLISDINTSATTVNSNQFDFSERQIKFPDDEYIVKNRISDRHKENKNKTNHVVLSKGKKAKTHASQGSRGDFTVSQRPAKLASAPSFLRFSGGSSSNTTSSIKEANFMYAKEHTAAIPTLRETLPVQSNHVADIKDEQESFTTSSLVTIKTAGAGDCAFHASLGEWNETKKQFECKNAASERAKVAKAIAESKPDDAIFALISASLKELIAGGISVGENIATARAAYQLYQQGQPELIDICWEEFEKELKKHTDIISHMQQYASRKSKRLKEQFNDCESKDGDRFFRTLIASDLKLDKAYRYYQNACSESFAWDDILRNPSILQEYAEFIGTPGKWLLPSELHIIAIALNITIKFYNVNAAVEIYNPNQDRVTAVYYNGANHYEKMIKSAHLSSSMRMSMTNCENAQSVEPVLPFSSTASIATAAFSFSRLETAASSINNDGQMTAATTRARKTK